MTPPDQHPKKYRRTPAALIEANTQPFIKRNGRPRTNGALRQSRFTFTRWIDVHYDPANADWLLHRMLPSEGVAVLYGKWKTFKSFIALDLCVAIANGDLWAGRKTKKGVVVYIAGEGGPGLAKRFEAYKRKRPELKDLDFYIGKVSPNLGSRPGDVDELVKAIRDLLHDEVPALVVIDTLSRTLAGKDENGEGMRNFADNAEDLSAELKCLVLAIHHEGAADTGRPRGGTVLDAASVATWHTKRPRNGDGLSVTLEIQEAKDSESGFTLAVRLARFEFGDLHDGERESTLIVDRIEDSAATGDDDAKSAPRIPKNQAAFMTAFAQALEKHGSRKRPFRDGPNVICVTREQVRERYFKVRADASDETKERDFRRQLGAAVTREDLVTREHDGETLLWRPRK